jgi:hypothetical protein
VTGTTTAAGAGAAAVTALRNSPSKAGGGGDGDGGRVMAVAACKAVRESLSEESMQRLFDMLALNHSQSAGGQSNSSFSSAIIGTKASPHTRSNSNPSKLSRCAPRRGDE